MRPLCAPARSDDPAGSPAPRVGQATLADEREVAAGSAETPGEVGAGPGTSSTFEEVYRRDYGRMVRVAHLLTGSNEAAEDVVQDAFVQLYARFATVGDSGGYLYRSVINGCRGRHRHRRVVERLRPLTTPPVAAVTEIDETWASLRRLSPRRRAVVVLRFYADLPLAEIAEILGCRVGTVKSMLHRAMADLREVIEP